MLRLDADRPPTLCSGSTRRDFLHAGALSALGLTLPGFLAQKAAGNVPPAESAGYLGRQYDPFILNADPAAPGFQVPDLLPPQYIPAGRAERRQRMRDAVDGALRSFESSPQARQMDSSFQLAYRLM